MAKYPYNSRDFVPPAPVLRVGISVPDSPLSMSVDAQLDSGADLTVLPEGVVSALRLPQVGFIKVRDFQERETRLPVFAAQVSTEFAAPEILRAITTQKDRALLGRDLLNRWVITLDGPQGLVDIEV